MVVVTGLAAIGTYVAASAFGVAIGISAVTGTFALAAIGLATQMVLGAALRALTPKPSIGGSNRGYQTTAIGTALDHQIIYGKMRVGGARLYDEATDTNNKYLHRIVAVAGHEIQSFDKIYINDSFVNFADIAADGNIPTVADPDGTTSGRYNGKLRIKFHLGSPTQTADTSLVAESAHWTSACTLSGIAYMYIRMEYDADVYPDGIPEFTAEIKGKKVYDPRTQTTTWSDNPALCLRDYLISPYGIAEETANIDDTLVITAANVCDQTNTIASTTRYTCNGAFTTASTPYDMINAMLTSMDGSLWYAQGSWRMKPAYWTAPVLDLNEDDLRSSISVSTRHSRRNNFNTVKGTFRGLESNWQTTDYPQVTNKTDAGDFVIGGAYAITLVGTTDFTAIGAASNTVGEVFVATGAGSGSGYADANLGADGGQESVADVDLPFTDNSIEARRIALISLERNRQQLTVNASFGLKTLQVQVGDNIRLTNSRFGWSNKEFEVVAWNFGLTDGLDLQTQMTLRETAESVYDEVDDGAVYQRDNTTLPSAFETATPQLDAPAASTFVNEDGTTVPEITFTWSVVNSSIVDHYEFQWKFSTDSTYNSVLLKDPKFILSPAESNKAYDSRVRSINALGVQSQFISSASPISTSNDGTIPNAPTSVTVSGGYAATTVEWAAPTANTDASAIKDLFQYAIYRDTSTNPTTLVGRVAGTTFSDIGLSDNTTYYYRVKALDFTGNASDYSLNGSGTTNAPLVDGTNGLNNATVFLYNKSSSATAPALFSGTFTYTFSTGVLSGGTLNSWSQEPPALSQGDNLWVSLATASSRTATDSVPTAEFSTPEITGVAGTNGANTARVSLFRKTSTNSAPADPSGTFTYTFSTGVLSGGTLNSWSQSAPSLNNGEYLWIIQASAFSSNATDTIAASEFTTASITGIGGTNGNPAKLLVLNATDQVFTYDADNVADPTSQTITFTAFLENTDDTTATWSSSPSVTLTGTGNTRSLPVANFGANTSVTITASADSVAVSDTFTVYRLKDGATGNTGTDALTLILSNEAHTFAADKDGVVASYSGSGTTIKLFEGTSSILYDGVGTSDGSFTVSASASSITAGTITDSGSFATVGNQSNMTADAADITYTITGKRADGSAISLTKTQSFSKSKVGADGASVTGPTGARGPGRWSIGIQSVSSGSFVVGTTYVITTVGTTDFTLIGAASNTLGLSFVATGVGSGNGTATPLPVTSSGADTDFTNAIGDPVDLDQAWFYAGTEANQIAQSVWIYASSGDSWNKQEEVINGDLLVTGSVNASKIAISDENSTSRIEIVSNKILVYNAGVLRVKIGDLS